LFKGHKEPPIIPTGNCLKTFKSKKLANLRRDKDVVTSLAIMKKEDEYKNTIHEIGYYPFYVNYYCSKQVHMYRGYCSSTNNPKLVIDATGSIVKKFHKFGEEKTNTKLLFTMVLNIRTLL